MDKPATAGRYEIHVSVRSLGRDDRFAALCQHLGCGCLIIELSRGETTHQPMLTQRLVGSVQQARSRAAELVFALRHAGLAPVRIKIEADLDSPDVPVTATVARQEPGCYFEHHVRLHLTERCDLGHLGRMVDPLGAHLSRNLRAVVRDGEHIRFITLRSRSVGKAEALEQLQRLMAVIQQERIAIVDFSSEYVIHDSRIALDHGWLGPTTTANPSQGRLPCGVG